MIYLVLALVPLAFVISMPLTSRLVRFGHALGTLDSAGVAGHDKGPLRHVPNTGGVAVFWAIVLPIVIGLWLVKDLDGSANAEYLDDFSLILADLHEHIAGIQAQAPLAMLLAGCLGLLHVLGLLDDRRPIGPWVKLAVMATPAFAVPLLSPTTRLVTFLDAHAGGEWASVAVTALWFLVVTNALNFMDNMDGLAPGVAVIAGGCFLAAAVLHEQWFVGACLALLVGATGGFLVYNFPWRREGARIFLGDGGSLVLGFLLAFLTVRTTYVPRGESEAAALGAFWYALFMPLVVLAVPIYDLVSVSLLRLSRGRSPLVGDLNHLSHRLVRRGFTRRGAVLVIHGLTAATGVAGIVLGRSGPRTALVVGCGVVVLLVAMGAAEYRGRERVLEKPGE